jgi:hypothetical protein
MDKEYVDRKTIFNEVIRRANRGTVGETTIPYLSWKDTIEIIRETPLEQVYPRGEVAEEIFKKLKSRVGFDGHNISVWKCDLVEIAKEYGVNFDEL